MKVLPQVAPTNHSTAISDDEVLRICKGLQKQVRYHFEPHWNAGCSIIQEVFTQVPNGAWELAFLDDSDQAGALGYHDFQPGPNAEPVMKVFAGTDKQYGLESSVTASHELLEALADPFIQTAIQTGNATFHALEVGDPVEDDSLGYAVTLADKTTVLVSDFVLPAWWWVGTTGLQYDFENHLSTPLQLAKGGYCSYWENGTWKQRSDFQAEQELPTVAGMLRPRPSADMRHEYARSQQG